MLSRYSAKKTATQAGRFWLQSNTRAGFSRYNSVWFCAGQIRYDCFTLNDIFLNHKQPPALRQFSTWEIKVFTKAIPELSRYALDSIVDL